MNLKQFFESSKTSKYHAKKMSYKGRNYDSKIEARRAAELDQLVMLSTVVFWIPQPIFLLIEGFNYRPDFLVAIKYGEEIRVHVEDVKAVETQRFRDAKRLWERHGKLPLHILKKVKNTWKTEVLTPACLPVCPTGRSTDTARRTDNKDR
jgi:hypothetical protein